MQATHYLRCAHQLGHNRREYWMKCVILKTMGNGKLKVRVFGYRYWKGHENSSRIRYISAARVFASQADISRPLRDTTHGHQ